MSSTPALRPPVDVLVPVYGAAAKLARCLATLRRHTDLAAHRLVLLIDGPQPPAVEGLLSPLEADPGTDRIEVDRAAERAGYVATVNRGMAATHADVVLLNSDTEVTAGWLDKLAGAAASAPRIASVTPFSNNATLCSLPRFLEENHLPSGHDADSFGQLVEACSQRVRPALPTGVGFCLYVTRAALDDVGAFDPARFGLGYGEEVEWCLRAWRRGWVHLLDDATFVYHAGQSSFGTSRGGRVRAAHRVLRRLHPGYLPEVAEFIRRDPLAPLRRRVVERLRPPPPVPRPPRSVVHLVHGWPPYAVGGTEQYARWLVERQARWRRVGVFARVSHPQRSLGDAIERIDHGARVRLLVNDFTQRDPLSRNALYDRRQAAALRRFLAEEEADLVHVHHLAGHAANLAAAAAAHGAPVVFQLQDWWAPCARANLFHRDGSLCSGPGIARCAACRPLTRLPGAALWNRLLHRFRRAAMRRALAAADVLVAGSRHIVETYRRWGFLPPTVPVRVIPYGIDERHLGDAAPGPSHGAPLRFGYVGALLPHKGVAVAVDAFRGVDPRAAVLEVWGNAAGDPAYAADLQRRAAPGSVTFHGTFRDEDRTHVLTRFDALLMPSLGYESYGLVVREAAAAGVPVLVSDRGALAEWVDAAGPEGPPGAVVPPGDVEAWRHRIERLIAQPSQFEAWQRRRRPVKGMDEHAEEIDAVYEEALRRRR